MDNARSLMLLALAASCSQPATPRAEPGEAPRPASTPDLLAAPAPKAASSAVTPTPLAWHVAAEVASTICTWCRARSIRDGVAFLVDDAVVLGDGSPDLQLGTTISALVPGADVGRVTAAGGSPRGPMWIATFDRIPDGRDWASQVLARSGETYKAVRTSPRNCALSYMHVVAGKSRWLAVVTSQNAWAGGSASGYRFEVLEGDGKPPQPTPAEPTMVDGRVQRPKLRCGFDPEMCTTRVVPLDVATFDSGAIVVAGATCHRGHGAVERWADEASAPVVDELPDAGPLHTLSARSPDDVWVAAQGRPYSQEPGYIARFDGKTWTRVSGPPRAVDSLSVTPSGSVWAVSDGKLWRKPTADGAWQPIHVDAPAVPRSVLARSDDDVWLMVDFTSGNDTLVRLLHTRPPTRKLTVKGPTR